MNEPLSIVDTSVSFLDTLENRSGKPLSAEEWLERAERLISVSRYGVAMREIQELMIREPTDPNPWLLEVKCRIARRTPETAIKVCHDLEEIYADDSNVLAQIDQLRRIAEDSKGRDIVGAAARLHMQEDDRRQDEGATGEQVRVNFIAPYFLRVLPQMAISGYMGKSETSYQMKMKKRSRLMKSPKNPVTSRK